MAKDKETGLTDKQKQFCHEYLIDLNATQSCIRAGYSEDTASEMGYENLGKPQIQNYIAELKAIRAKRCEITQDNVLKEYAKIAFSDIRHFYDAEGNLRKPHQLDDNAAAGLSSVDVDEIKEYDREKGQNNVIGVTKKIKLYNKISALDSLGKHLGLFEKDNNQRKMEGFSLIIKEVISKDVRNNIQNNTSSEGDVEQSNGEV